MLSRFSELFGASPLVCGSRGPEGHFYKGGKWASDTEVRGTAPGPPATPKGPGNSQGETSELTKRLSDSTLSGSFGFSLMRINEHFHEEFNYTA